jgi:hypothetical protein
MKKNILTILIIQCCLLGCSPEFKSKVKDLLFEDDKPPAIQTEVVQHESPKKGEECNDEDYKELVLKIIKDEVLEQSNIKESKFVVQPGFDILTIESQNEIKTVCDARIIYSYPKEIDNKSQYKLNIKYEIQKNELVKNQNVVKVLYADFGKLISFNEGYNSKKEDFLFEKLQIKRVKPNETNGTVENINFNVMKQSLMLNDWNLDEQAIKCNFDKVGDFTQCSYRFTKKSYEFAVITRRKNECLFCSKKPEEVYSTNVSEI